MYTTCFSVLFIFTGFFTCEAITRPQVTTPLGTIKGSFYQSVGGRTYEAYEGIPYAKPPVKKYRFREPRPVKSWEGTLEGRFLYTCMQYNHYSRQVIGDEDCLYLNVYTPRVSGAPLDVIVYIHGGAFMFGSGHSYKQDILMDRDVIYVNLNYRLGAFGFLSTEDNTVSGNNGMKDQVMALKWIKSNIEYFGGNPNSITLTGMSAGGASVHLHYMSPLSTGLFTQGFSLSGTALNPWVLQENALEKTKKLASAVDCDSSNMHDLIRCLSNIPARVVTEAEKNLFAFLYNPFSPFGVVVEPSTSLNPFLPEHPYELLRTGKIQDLPWITSVVQSEGLYPAAEFYSDPNYLQELETRWNELTPHVLDYNYTAASNHHPTIAQKAKEFYLRGEPISKNSFNNLVQMIGDRLFVADAELAAKMQAKITSSPVFFYYFTYRGAHSKSEALSKCNENFGAAHGDDTVYVLKSDVDVSTTDSDKKMSQVLLDLWTGYAKNGLPAFDNSSWKAVSTNIKEVLNYLEIKSPESSVEESKDFAASEFWHKLPLKENANLFPLVHEEF